MKNAIIVTEGSRIVGVFSNLKKLWNEIDSVNKQGYSTVALTLSIGRPYDVGYCVIQGNNYQNIRIQKFEVNHVREYK
jgi:hypothetical protein